jgi:hypothetical protein
MSGIVIRLTQTAEYTVEYDIHDCDVRVIRAYAPFLLAGFEDGSIKVWELEVQYSFPDRPPLSVLTMLCQTGLCKFVLKHETRKTGACLSLTVCDSLVFAGFAGGQICIWDIYVCKIHRSRGRC